MAGYSLAKYACTSTYVALHEVTCSMPLYGVGLSVQNLRRDGSSSMWHQPCQRCKYTTSVDIQKRAVKSYSVTHVTVAESHASAVSLLESGDLNSAGYIKAINNNYYPLHTPSSPPPPPPSPLSPSLISLMVSVDVKHCLLTIRFAETDQESNVSAAWGKP